MKSCEFGEESVPRASGVCRLDLTELSAIYDEASIARLLSQSLEYLDAQWAHFDSCVASGQWRPAAEALHRVKGTFAFLCNDARTLAPICAAETALRIGTPAQVAPHVATMRRVQAVYRDALCEAMQARTEH
jgi:hypothetical protein